MKLKMIPFYFAIFIELITCLFLIYFSYLYFYPVKVIEARTQPYQVLTKKVRIGQQLQYVVDACKYSDSPASVSRSYVDASKGTIYPDITEVNRLPATCQKSTVSTTVPPSILPGKYYLQLDLTYRVNFLKEVQYHFVTQQFEVLPMETK